MYLKCTNPALQEFRYREFMDERRTVTKTGTVRVPDTVGQELLERYPDDFEVHENEPTENHDTN